MAAVVEKNNFKWDELEQYYKEGNAIPENTWLQITTKDELTEVVVSLNLCLKGATWLGKAVGLAMSLFEMRDKVTVIRVTRGAILMPENHEIQEVAILGSDASRKKVSVDLRHELVAVVKTTDLAEIILDYVGGHLHSSSDRIATATTFEYSIGTGGNKALLKMD